MSALEQSPPPSPSSSSSSTSSSSPFERRRSLRTRPSETIPVHIGRAAGTLVDLGTRGARVRHTGNVGRGTTQRLTLHWQNKTFAATATVLSSRVIALGGPTYESRLHFIEVTHENEAVLRELLVLIQNADLRRAVENLRGVTEHRQQDDASSPKEHGFLRCRFFASGRWEKKWTRDARQPDEGVTVPASMADFELAQLCRSYERIDPEGRAMLRRIAESIIDSSHTAAR